MIFDRNRAVPLVTNDLLDNLPLYADDNDIAVAIVGKKQATHFKSILPILERQGFPKRCPLYGGRSTYLVRLYYTSRLAPQALLAHSQAEQVQIEQARRLTEERMEEYARQKAEKKARAKANSDAWAEKKRKALEEFQAKKAKEDDA